MKKLLALALLAYAASALAGGLLVSESVSGNIKTCIYSNGAVLQVTAYTSCPMRVN